MNNIAVIILTFNEETNLGQALDSLFGWADELFVLDSYSTDRTVEIARSYGCTVVQNHFEGYAKQRNFALERLPIQSDWIFFLDADEWVPEVLKCEIRKVIDSQPQENGFYIKRRLVWMGCWIRRGYYPTWILRLFRRGKGRCEDRAINEHLIVEDKVGYLKNDFMHEDQKGITDWIAKHNSYATHEALELLRNRQICGNDGIDARFFGTQVQRKRWLRHRVWEQMPPIWRPFFYFFYRYVLKGGFLDGRIAFTYHFLQGLWFPLLIDIKHMELKASDDQYNDRTR